MAAWAAPSAVRLLVYDVTGRLVCMLAASEQGAGAYEAVWDGRDQTGRPVASGLYLYRLQAGAFGQTRTLLRLR